jgi:hypothetical protein
LENATDGPGAIARVTLPRTGSGDGGDEPAVPENGPGS